MSFAIGMTAILFGGRGRPPVAEKAADIGRGLAGRFAAVAVFAALAGFFYQLGITSLFGAYVFSFALLGLRWPARLLETFVFFVALGHRDFTYVAMNLGSGNSGNAKIFITEWVLAILLAAALPRAWNVVKKNLPGMAMVGVYFSSGAVILFLSFGEWPLSSALRDFAIVYYSLFAVAVMAHIDGHRGVRRIAFALLLGTLPNLAGDILNYLYGSLPLTPDQKNYSMRNSFYYLATTGFVLPMVLREGGRVRVWPIVYCLAVYLVVVLYSYSKTAMVAALILTVVYFLPRLRRVRVAVLIVAAALFILPFFLTPKDKVFHFYSVFSESTYLHDSRRLLQVAAMRDFSEYPYGIGFGPPIFGQHSRSMIKGIEGFQAIHNSYLTLLRRMGIVGFAVFIALIIHVGYGAFRNCRSLPDGLWQKDLTMGAAFAGLACGIFAYAHVALEGPYMGAVFWLMIGCMLVSGGTPSGDVEGHAG